MRLPRYQTKTLLLAVAVAAISIGGFLPWHDVERHSFGGPTPPLEEARDYFVESLIWVPPIFIAYAIGRRALTVRIVIAFAIAELLAVWHWYQIYS
jgi:hypothetical protein